MVTVIKGMSFYINLDLRFQIIDGKYTHEDGVASGSRTYLKKLTGGQLVHVNMFGHDHFVVTVKNGIFRLDTILVENKPYSTFSDMHAVFKFPKIQEPIQLFVP